MGQDLVEHGDAPDARGEVGDLARVRVRLRVRG